MLNKREIVGMLFSALLGVSGFWIGYMAHKEPQVAPPVRDYIATYNCLTEDIMIVDGVEKVRYLCDAESSNAI